MRVIGIWAQRVIRIWAPALAALPLGAAPAQGATGPVRFLADSFPRGRGSYVQLDTNPTRLTGRQESPSAVSFLLPRGMGFDRQAVKRECSLAAAAAARCPRVARVGFGHVVVHFAGYLFPGGQTDGVAYLTAFLSPPRRSGDRGSLTIQVRWLGADRLIATANRYLRTHLKPKYSLIGRIVALRGGRYGLELAFSGMPGGVQVPPALRAAGVSAKMTRFKLLLGRVRRVKVPLTRVVGSGPFARTVHDHKLVAHHLLSRPASCPGSRGWPWQLRLGFPDGGQRVSGLVGCR